MSTKIGLLDSTFTGKLLYGPLIACLIMSNLPFCKRLSVGKIRCSTLMVKRTKLGSLLWV